MERHDFDHIRRIHKSGVNAQPRTARRHISDRMGTRVYQSLKGISKTGSWSKLLGYSPEELMAHLEAKFLDEMTWDNYGSGWHIDHIRPIASFSFTCPSDAAFMECWALTNLQPLWASENMRKGATWQGRYHGRKAV